MSTFFKPCARFFRMNHKMDSVAKVKIRDFLYCRVNTADLTLRPPGAGWPPSDRHRTVRPI
jgi:hypothetical protein